MSCATIYQTPSSRALRFRIYYAVKANRAGDPAPACRDGLFLRHRVGRRSQMAMDAVRRPSAFPSATRQEDARHRAPPALASRSDLRRASTEVERRSLAEARAARDVRRVLDRVAEGMRSAGAPASIRISTSATERWSKEEPIAASRRQDLRRRVCLHRIVDPGIGNALTEALKLSARNRGRPPGQGPFGRRVARKSGYVAWPSVSIARGCRAQ